LCYLEGHGGNKKMKMKKFIVLITMLTAIVCFTVPISGDVSDSVRTITPENAKEKRERYQLLKRQALRHAEQCSSLLRTVSSDTPASNGFEVIKTPDTVNLQPDEFGKVVMTGLCKNVSAPQAVLIFVSVDFSDGGVPQGTELGMAYGSTNVQVAGDGGVLALCSIEPGDQGFFQVWAEDVDYSTTLTYTVNFYYGTAETGVLPPANAQLEVDGDLAYHSYEENKLHITGNAKNPSSTHVAFGTMVGMAVFDPTDTKVVDVGAWIVGDSSSPGYDYSVYPLQSTPFHVFFEFVHCGSSFNEVGTRYFPCFVYLETALDVSGDSASPFGELSTPVSGANVSGSVAVTGWALDETGLTGLKIYRREGAGLVYVGDANFVEGARADVAAAYPAYPNNTKAGWGYMLLTHFLPNGGNGTYTLHAIATDVAGKQTTVGTTTFTCDNANAVKPFGAIDTPSQGGAAYGDAFKNWGWVLTPNPPNYIPYDGSTIDVYVNGAFVGRPSYDMYRSDIADLFPGYANSNGAAGCYILDTTTYEDDVYTIYWSVTDNEGNAEGIGSRFFSIINEAVTLRAASERCAAAEVDLSKIPTAQPRPLMVKKGYSKNRRPRTVAPDKTGIIHITTKELERIKIRLFLDGTGGLAPLYSPLYSVYHAVGDQLYRKPAGSIMDNQTGTFYWQPGPGVLGEHRLIFIKEEANGRKSRFHVTITIVPGL
jgi:hypothetical protein